jgi:hypothetical protein
MTFLWFNRRIGNMQMAIPLILGDILTIALVTIIGFASHGEAGLTFLPRIAAAFFPLLISWFLLAPALGLFWPEIVYDLKQLWRPAVTGVFAGSFAAVLRGFILNAPVIPIFAVVLGTTTAIGMVIWRGLYYLLQRNANVNQ